MDRCRKLTGLPKALPLGELAKTAVFDGEGIDIFRPACYHISRVICAQSVCAKLIQLERYSIMERIKTIATRDLTKSVVTGGCGECQTSCQSACKTSCGVANQKCENSNK